MRGGFCSLYCTDDDIEAYSGLITYSPNWDPAECERGCFYWLLGDNRGKLGLSPASQDVSSSCLTNLPMFTQLISSRATSWTLGFQTLAIVLLHLSWRVSPTLANSQQDHRRARTLAPLFCQPLLHHSMSWACYYFTVQWHGPLPWAPVCQAVDRWHSPFCSWLETHGLWSQMWLQMWLWVLIS